MSNEFEIIYQDVRKEAINVPKVVTENVRWTTLTLSKEGLSLRIESFDAFNDNPVPLIQVMKTNPTVRVVDFLAHILPDLTNTYLITRNVAHPSVSSSAGG